MKSKSLFNHRIFIRAYIILSIITCVVTSCSEGLELAPINTTVSTLQPVQQNNLQLSNGYSWTKLTAPVFNDYPFNFPDTDNAIYQVGSETYLAIGGLQEVWYKLNQSTMQWEYFQDQFIAEYVYLYKYFFSYGSKIYWSTFQGSNPRQFTASDVVTKVDTKLADFPGTISDDLITFVVGSKGYVMGGAKNNQVINQYWEYDFITNQWTNLGTMPGGARAGGFVKIIRNTVYFGLGYDYAYFHGVLQKRYRSDWYSFAPYVTNIAEPKASFPGTKRIYAKGFAVNGNVYLGWGYNAGTGTNLNDYWEYSPSTNAWINKGTGPVISENDNNIGAFAIGNTGYLVKGNLAAFWRYGSGVLLP